MPETTPTRPPRRTTALRRVLVPLVLLSALGGARAAEVPPTGRLIEGVACRNDPSKTYTLYLPSAYTPERSWPTMVILDPRGRSVLAAELFRDAAERYGWILLSSNDTRSDTADEQNIATMNALLPDAAFRYATDRRRLYLAGFSGGAMLAWLVATQTGTITGVISSGGRPAPKEFSDATAFASFGTTGTTDFNYREMHRADELLAEKGLPHRLEVFEGPHSWMPKAMARQGVEWMELLAMKQGLRPRDEALVKSLYAEDLARAKELEEGGEPLAAMRRFAAVAATFEGLADVSGPRAEAARLGDTPEVQAALKQEEHWASFEDHYLDAMFRTLAKLEPDDAVVSTGRLLGALRVAELKKRADAPGVEGVTARRLLESLWVRTGFYMTQNFFATGRYARAEQVLTIAADVKDDRPGVWYNLACARARLGHTKPALEALERAVHLGYSDLAHLEADADLASLRRTPGYRALAARLGGGAAP